VRAQGHTKGVLCAAVYYDPRGGDSGALVASGGADGAVAVWATAAGRLIAKKVLHIHAAPVVAVSLSRDGRYAISASLDGTVHTLSLTGSGTGDGSYIDRVGPSAAAQLPLYTRLCDAIAGARAPAGMARAASKVTVVDLLDGGGGDEDDVGERVGRGLGEGAAEAAASRGSRMAARIAAHVAAEHKLESDAARAGYRERLAGLQVGA
jgi:hypothetical protein